MFASAFAVWHAANTENAATPASSLPQAALFLECSQDFAKRGDVRDVLAPHLRGKRAHKLFWHECQQSIRGVPLSHHGVESIADPSASVSPLSRRPTLCLEGL